MLNFNPSIFEFKNKKYILLRGETQNNYNFNDSIFSYSLCNLDDKNKIIKKNKCSIIYEDNKYTEILRSTCNKSNILPEDIKIFPFLINNKIIGFANLLYEINPSRMNVGLIELNIEKYQIKIIKIYNLYNSYLIEKNWSIFTYLKKYYVIYSVFPYLIIYEFNIKNYELTLYQKTYTFNQIAYEIDFRNINNNYKHIFLTLCSFPIEVEKNKFLIFVKKRCNTNIYEYYKSFLIFKNNKFEIIFENNIIFAEKMLYLNDIKKINNKFLMCFGVNDSSFKITEYVYKK
jgi:hypothetical protein